MTERPVICEAIDRIAKAADLSDNAIARKAGISRVQVCNIRNGVRFPSAESLQAICEALPGRAGRVYSLASQIANERTQHLQVAV